MATQDTLAPGELQDLTPAMLRVFERWGYPLPPIAGADGDGDGDEGSDDAGDQDEADTSSDTGQGDENEKPDPGDWKQQARRHEREAKRAREKTAELERKLREREDADKTDQQKAIDAARDEARAEADKERRADRLELAVTKLAVKTFADTDDALANLERALRDGTTTQDEIFNSDGRVNTQAVQEALQDILERKPHLAASAGKPKGDADAGKGKGGSGTDLEGMSVEDHLKDIRVRT